MSPLLSVIVPTYNRAHFLPDIIYSLYSQHYLSLEIVVVDDGSLDNTEAVFKQLQSVSKPVEMSLSYINQANRGASSARNLGLNSSSGDFVLFVDSDDLVLKDGIAAGMAVLSDNCLDYIYSPILKREVFPGGLLESPLGSYFNGSDSSLLDYNWHTMGIIYKRTFLDRIGGWNESIRTSDDWEFQVRVKLANGAGRFVDVPIGIWNLHAGLRLSASTYQAPYVSDLLAVCQSICDHCARAGRLSEPVKSRLFRRLTRHALEAGAHGDCQLRQLILASGRPLATGLLHRAFQQWLEMVPLKASDSLLYSIVRKVFS